MGLFHKCLNIDPSCSVSDTSPAKQSNLPIAAGVVHLTGGISGLVGTTILGARTGRFTNPEDFWVQTGEQLQHTHLMCVYYVIDKEHGPG